jgi:hypothetical protein
MPPGRREFESPVIMAGVTLYIIWELEARFGGWEIVWTVCEGHLANLRVSTVVLACNRSGPKAKSVSLEAVYIGQYTPKQSYGKILCVQCSYRTMPDTNRAGLRMVLVGM